MLTSADIGKTVYISNSVSPCQEWRVADVNHDGTVGTVDLFPKYVVNNGRIFDRVSNSYYRSDLRSWLNNDFYNGFTEDVKNAMKVQSFPSDGDTLNNKVKCPSLNEVGLTCDDCLLYEGTIYPIFGDTLINNRVNPLSKYTTTDGSEIEYWTRSRYTEFSSTLWHVSSDGILSMYASYDASWGVVACIRF